MSNNTYDVCMNSLTAVICLHSQRSFGTQELNCAEEINVLKVLKSS